MVALADPPPPTGGAANASVIIARHSLRRRLLAAFIGLSLLVVIAALIAVLSLWLNQRSHDRISSQSIPIAAASLDLTRSAQRVVEVVPDLVAAQTVAEQTALTADLQAEVVRLNAVLDDLGAFDIDPRAAASIDRSASQFSDNISAINRLVSARIATAVTFDAAVTAGLDAVNAALSIVEPLAVRDEVGLGRVIASDPAYVVRKQRLIEAQSAGLEMRLLLSIFSTLDPDVAAARVAAALQRMSDVVEDIPAESREDYARSLDTLSAIMLGSNSLARMRAFEAQLVAAGEQALLENGDLAGRFAEAVDRLITVARADVLDANANAVKVQQTAFWLLSSVVGATLLTSFLIVRFYVQRSILARLTALTSSMMEIANGNLSAPIPKEGDDELGSMAMALRVFRDTAVQVRDYNLREIRETRSRLSHAIENIQEGFALFDADDAMILSNAQFGNLLLDGDQAIPAGTTYPALLNSLVAAGQITPEIAEPEDWIAAALSRHQEPAGTQIWQLSGDRWVGATERRTDDGGMVMVVTDLTAIKRHERELDQLVEKLSRASAAKSSFIANVSHELRTPLTAVLGFAQIVQNRLENVLFPRIEGGDRATDRALSQVRENITIMIQEGKRLTKMINDILDLEKIEAGQMIWEIEPLDMGSIIRQAAAATNSLYSKKNLQFHINVEPDLPLVSGDHDRLVQVVINLISNAVKFTDRGHVACSASRGDGDFVSVSITDTGVGIAPADQLEVFEKFRQVGDTLTEKPSGTGLGLPICREIVEHLGGSITVESLPGFGSTFTFQLPVARMGAAPIRKKGGFDVKEDSHS